MEQTLTGVLLSVLAVVFWGVGNTVARVGLQSIKAASGTVLSVAVSLIVALVITLAFEFEALVSVSLAAVGWSVLVGIFHFALGRVFLYQGMKYIGAARGTSISSSSPLFAIILAIMFLKETPTILIIIGTVLIVGGLFVLLSERGETRITTKNRMIGYGFGLATALCWGAVAVLVRFASQFAPPFVVLTISLLSGMLLLLAATGKGLQIGTNKKAINLMLLAGLLNGIGVIGYYSALAIAPVVLVAPLVAASPLVTALCVHLFLQRLERITLQVVSGCFLVVIGGALVAIF